MPVFELISDIIFPPVEMSTREGILAVGGDLSPERLLCAYRSGIFPWYMPESPIIWWSPDPRFVLFTDELKVPRSMRRIFNRNYFRFTFDTQFEEVIKSCSLPRKDEKSTWLVPEMIDAYIELNRLGYAHSAEAWSGDRLAGGLYGVSLGRCFFGESMFTRENNASKATLIFLAQRLRELGFKMIDSQVYTSHLAMLGARMIPRSEYLEYLKESLKYESITGNWGKLAEWKTGNIDPALL